MYLKNNKTYITYHKVDVTDILKRLREINTEELWLSNISNPDIKNDSENIKAIKRELSSTRLFTRCTEDDVIPLRFRKQFVKENIESKEYFVKMVNNFKTNFIDEQLNNLTDNIVKELEKLFDGVAGLVMYSQLLAGKKIDLHIDGGYYMDMSRRFHIPIITNDDVKFTINDTVFHMETGMLYEINNKFRHGVENQGNQDRVHLIIDIIPRENLPS